MPKSRAVKRTLTIGFESVCIALLSAPVLAEGDMAAGEKVYQRCVVCHGTLDQAQPKRMGPPLYGTIGRAVASVEDYEYSDSMKEFGAIGAQWDEATLDQFLKEPVLFIKGTKMVAPPVRRDQNVPS